MTLESLGENWIDKQEFSHGCKNEPYERPAANCDQQGNQDSQMQ